VGAGSLFFAMAPDAACLSDVNPGLITAYNSVKRNHDRLHLLLENHRDLSSSDYYYSIRKRYNESADEPESIERAADFVYLNSAGFNGLWRVNREGRYNVPYGGRQPPRIPQLHTLALASRKLANASIVCGDFREQLARCCRGDFVYIDPPYRYAERGSAFNRYHCNGMGEEDYHELFAMVRGLRAMGCQVMVTFPDSNWIRDLVKGMTITEVSFRESVRARGDRQQVKELIITNY
jgi:DNA adenine methylase